MTELGGAENQPLFHIFVQSVLNNAMVADNIQRFESKVEKMRARLLADPLTAWALTYISALEMQKAAAGNRINDFIVADLLVRPLDVVQAERKAEKAKQDRLQETVPLNEIAAARYRLAIQRLGELTGDNPDMIQVESFKKVIGPQTGLVEKLGELYAEQVITALLSTRNVNLLIPLSQSVLSVIEELEEVAGLTKYTAWMQKRSIEAKKKGWLKKPNKKALATIDDAIAGIKEKYPELGYIAFFTKAAAQALPVHQQPIPKKQSTSDVRAAWEAVARANAPMAVFTHAGREEQKAQQAGGAESRRNDPGLEGGYAGSEAPPAPDTSQGLLTDEDIQDLRR